MKRITSEMLRIYKSYSGLDWMNYKIVRKEMTSHHIIKRDDGGKLVMDNIALLMPASHEYLHIIECKEIKIYEDINKCFIAINKSKREPEKDMREYIEYLLERFELLHRWDKNSRGKRLIKERYLKRW